MNIIICRPERIIILLWNSTTATEGLSRILCKLHYRDSPLKGRLTLTVDADRSVPERKRRVGAAFDPSFGHGLSIYA